jgi:hypothetical protein
MKSSHAHNLEDIDKITKNLIGDISFQRGGEVTDAYTDSIHFNNYINEKYGEISISGYSFFPSRILLVCNPVAYRVELQRFMRAKGWQEV